MSVPSHDEKRDFYIFLTALFISAAVISSGLSAQSVYGLLGALWGAYGFMRLLYISQSPESQKSKFLNLPAKILFSLTAKQEEKRQKTLKRVEAMDFIFWFILAFCFAVWAIYCSLFPAEISTLQTIKLKQETLIEIPFEPLPVIFEIIKSLSFYGVVAITVFLSITFSYSYNTVKDALYGLFPVFCAAMVFQFFFLPISNPVMFPTLKNPVGGGFGTTEIMALISPDTDTNPKTGLIARAQELGWVGAYGLYIVFLPVLLTLFKAYFIEQRIIIPAIGIMTIFLVLLLDIFWLSSPAISGLIFIGIAIIGLSWGISGISLYDLTKEQK